MAARKLSLTKSSSLVNTPKLSLQKLSATGSGTKLVQNSKEFIEENLKGALVDWLKEQPLYTNGSVSDKGVQENIVKELADKLISLVEQSPSQTGQDDIDFLLLEEIKNHVQKFPIDSKLKSKHNYIEELPAQILTHLKSLKLFHDISQRDDQTSLDLNISKWIDDMPLIQMTTAEKSNLQTLKEQFIEKIKQSGLQYETTLRDETKKFLENVSLQIEDEKEKEKLLYDLEETFIETIAKKPRKLRLLELSNKCVEETVEQWIKTLVLPKPDDDSLKDVLSKAKTDMVTTLSNKFVYTDEVPLKQFNEVFRDATNQFLEQIPNHQYKSDDIDILIKSLEDTFKEYSKKYPMLPTTKPVKKKAAVALLEDISKWVNKLPIESSSPEGQLESEKTKLQLESKLIHKIGEMNMNIEIFNDDFLYGDMLDEEIDSLLTNISSENIQDNKQQLKRNLIDIILKARQSIKDENSNQIYKQQLHETISKMLPTSDWSEEGLASLEVLKDDVADAYINMRYIGNDIEVMHKLKKQINDKIHQFCQDYLKRCPASPLDTKTLSQKLYNALNKITEPQNESFRSEVEIIKLKHEINNWMKILLMKEQDAYDKLQTNKMISALAKKLHDIETNKELISSQEYDEKVRKEIKKFLYKQPLETGNDEEINKHAETLAKNLSETEEFRKLNASMRSSFSCPGRNSIPQIRISFNDASISPESASPVEVKDCSLGTCLEPPQCLVEKDSSAQTPCAGMRAIGSQMSVNSHFEDDEFCWETVEKRSVRTSLPGSTDGRLPCVPKCPQQPECLIPRQNSQCTQEALKSCLITRPYPLQPHKKQLTKQHQIIREPCVPVKCDGDDYDYQSPFKPKAREINLPSSQMPCSGPCVASTSTPYSTPERNNGSQRRLSTPWQLTHPPAGSNSSYPFHLSTEPRPGSVREEFNNTSQWVPEGSSETATTETQYNPGQPCPISHQMSGQRRVLESQYIPCQRSGTMQMVSEPPASCLLYPPHRQTRDQPWMAPRSSVTYSPSQHVPCPIRPPRPCCRPDLPITAEDCGTRPSYPPGFQRPVTHLGSFDHMDPQSCLARQRKWGKARNEERSWESEREYFHSDEEFNQREGKRCRCQQKYGEYYVRRLFSLFYLLPFL